ncbi:hypothetical protein BGZ47_002930 [Haplosporangium gracile]|nr:hypothetical protein BGZ47_002930 [Haplosporangium gracile]
MPRYNKARTVMQSVLHEYIPITEQYIPIMDRGDIPPPRYGHCMVEAYGGSKIILFEGVTDLNPTSADIFIFDVATLTWTQGQTGDSTVGRAYAVCAVTNDMFVAWGGAIQLDNNFCVVKAPMNFSPDNVVASSHVGSIVGGVAGGLALVSAVMLGFVVYRRKQRKRTEKRFLSKGEGGIGSGFTSDDSITLKHEGGEGAQRSSYVVHAPVTDNSPMAPTDYESTAYTAIGYAQSGSQPQPQVYNPVSAGLVVDGSMYYTRYTPPTQ